MRDLRDVDLFWQFPENLNPKPLALRLCIMTILKGKYQDLICILGILCSTWTVVNSGTSQRDFLTPLGQTAYPSVVTGNIMVSRRLGIILILI